jgi:hypothetical protein
MAAWIPMFALPNISLEEAIEVDGVALASIADNRIQELVNKHESFATYLDSFRSEFGLHLQPSIIIRRDDTTELYRSVEALSGFRDAIALSVVPYAWATYLRFGNLPDITYSDWFAIYPWMLDKNYEYVVMNSMATGLGLDEVKELILNPLPALSRVLSFAVLSIAHYSLRSWSVGSIGTRRRRPRGRIRRCSGH